MASIAVRPERLTYSEARERVLAAVRPLPGERVALGAALGRALRVDVFADHPLPPFANSAMDGFAVRAADLAKARADAPVELPVVEVLPAGAVAARALAGGEAIRIMTGAALPEGADAVVPFEDCERLESGGAERARFTRPAEPGAHVRRAGADLERGAPALAEGRELSAHDLAVLASLGVATVEVGPMPRVAVFSTGDELLEVDQPLRPGAIRDSNRVQLVALLEEARCRVVRAERAPDAARALVPRIGAALEQADVVITIGGISMGDFDPVKESLSGLGGVAWWRVAMRPGQSQAFGVSGGALFFGLPGNPASVACVFEALVRPAIRKLQGHRTLDRPRLRVRVAGPIASKPGRVDLVRAALEWRDEAWWAREAGAQVSGHVMPQSRAHALLVVPEEAERLEAGAAAEAWVLRWPETAA